ncbi:hypothetical protein ACC677_36770, partial [Rhizobium ruizarguesonis]
GTLDVDGIHPVAADIRQFADIRIGVFELPRLISGVTDGGGIANEIRMEWNDSGSATINLLMQWADKAIEEKRNPAALDFLDEAIELKPDYAESWNRRAT